MGSPAFKIDADSGSAAQAGDVVHDQKLDAGSASRGTLSKQATRPPEPNSVAPVPGHVEPATEHHGVSFGKVAKNVAIGYGCIFGGVVALGALAIGVREFRMAFLPVAEPLGNFVAHDLEELGTSAWRTLITSGSRTSDPLRTLIQMADYGGGPSDAVRMEQIISGVRNAVLKGQLKTASQVEDGIAANYLRTWHAHSTGFEVFDGDRAAFTDAIRTDSKMRLTQSKHFPYTVAQESDWLGQRNEVELGGQNYYTNTLRKRFGALQFLLPKDEAFENAAAKRIDDLFAETVASRDAEHTPENLKAGLERAGELEWLTARRWRYRRGTAGISQLSARTWLEVGGIDSGRFAKGIDPNMEALTRPLNDYKQNYHTFFEKAPSFF